MSEEIIARIQKALDENVLLRSQVEELRDRMTVAEQENRHLKDRLSESEEEQFRFVNLYIACQRLAMSPDVGEILEILQEIVVNLVGSEQYGLYFVGKTEGSPLELIVERVEGTGECRRPPATHPRIVEAFETGGIYVSETRDSSPVAVIPLKNHDQVLGALVLYGILPQKAAFTPIDVELFELLSSLAGRALYSAAVCPKMDELKEWSELLRRQFNRSDTLDICPG